MRLAKAVDINRPIVWEHEQDALYPWCGNYLGQ